MPEGYTLTVTPAVNDQALVVVMYYGKVIISQLVDTRHITPAEPIDLNA